MQISSFFDAHDFFFFFAFSYCFQSSTTDIFFFVLFFFGFGLTVYTLKFTWGIMLSLTVHSSNFFVQPHIKHTTMAPYVRESVLYCLCFFIQCWCVFFFSLFFLCCFRYAPSHRIVRIYVADKWSKKKINELFLFHSCLLLLLLLLLLQSIEKIREFIPNTHNFY